ncbi:MAG TPA: DciA family protein [Caulobacteraceae bacterium]
MIRKLPTPAEAARILAERRTKPVRRPPPLAARALAATLRALDAKYGQGADGLKARWSEIVGKTLARRTEPVRLSSGRAGGGATLEIRVDGPVATLIQHQASEILARVNLFLGPQAVERLRIVQGRLRGATRSLAPVKLRPRGPLDAAKEQALAESLSGLPDGRLKSALARLGREVMRGERP